MESTVKITIDNWRNDEIYGNELKAAYDNGLIDKWNFRNIRNDQKFTFFYGFIITIMSHIIEFVNEARNTTDINFLIEKQQNEINAELSNNKHIVEEIKKDNLRIEFIKGSQKKIINKIITTYTSLITKPHILKFTDHQILYAKQKFLKWLENIKENDLNKKVIVTKNPRKFVYNELQKITSLEDRLNFWDELQENLYLDRTIYLDKPFRYNAYYEILWDKQAELLIYLLLCEKKSIEFPSDPYIIRTTKIKGFEPRVSIGIPYSIWKKYFERLALDEEGSRFLNKQYQKWMLFNYDSEIQLQIKKYRFEYKLENADRNYLIKSELKEINDFFFNAETESKKFYDNENSYSSRNYWLFYIYKTGLYIDKLHDLSVLTEIVAKEKFRDYLNSLQISSSANRLEFGSIEKMKTSFWAFYYHILHTINPKERFENDPEGKVKAIQKLCKGKEINSKRFQLVYNEIDNQPEKRISRRRIPILNKLKEIFLDNQVALSLIEDYLNQIIKKT